MAVQKFIPSSYIGTIIYIHVIISSNLKKIVSIETEWGSIKILIINQKKFSMMSIETIVWSQSHPIENSKINNYR